MNEPLIVAGIIASLATAVLVFGNRFIPHSFNERVASIARSVIGLGATSGLDDFEDLLGGPGESKNTELQMATAPQSSTCGLVVGGIWRRAGIKHKSLAPPYIIATAISRLQKIAQEFGAWVTGAELLTYVPQLGDTLMLDVDKPSGHVNTVIGVEKTPTGWVLQTVDGGAKDAAGKQYIAERTHTLTRVGNRLHSVSSIGVAHDVTGIVNVGKLVKLTA